MRKSRKISSATRASPSRTGTPQASQLILKDLLPALWVDEHKATGSKLLLLRLRNCSADKAALPPFKMSTSLLKTSFALTRKKDFLSFLTSRAQGSAVGKAEPWGKAHLMQHLQQREDRTGWPGMWENQDPCTCNTFVSLQREEKCVFPRALCNLAAQYH